MASKIPKIKGVPACVNLTTYVQGMSDYELMCYIVSIVNLVVDSVNNTNENVESIEKQILNIKQQISEIDSRIDSLIDENTILNLVNDAITSSVNMVFFGLTDDGHFCAWITENYKDIEFGTILDCDSDDYGKLTISY